MTGPKLTAALRRSKEAVKLIDGVRVIVLSPQDAIQLVTGQDFIGHGSRKRVTSIQRIPHVPKWQKCYRTTDAVLFPVYQ